MERKKQLELIRQSALEHKRKLENDPEYRKQSEETKRLLRENLLMLGHEEK